jgi:hypothetical protein
MTLFPEQILCRIEWNDRIDSPEKFREITKQKPSVADAPAQIRTRHPWICQKQFVRLVKKFSIANSS